MSHEPKGSTPGLIDEERHERKDLTKVNTFPSVDFSIPPSDPPEQVVRCASRRTQGAGAPDKEKSERGPGDEESQSSQSEPNDENEVTYPEGGLQAWLVVFGGFMASFVGFGMM